MSIDDILLAVVAGEAGDALRYEAFVNLSKEARARLVSYEERAPSGHSRLMYHDRLSDRRFQNPRDTEWQAIREGRWKPPADHPMASEYGRLRANYLLSRMAA